jgi:Mg2+ and Co2+ transporter CorA
MNVELPLMDHPVTFLLILALMASIAAGMLAYFRHRRWL